MITAGEIRIGNWFDFKHYPFVDEKVIETHYKRAAITQEDIHLAEECALQIEECLAPILLTPEILDKAGFIKQVFETFVSYDMDFIKDDVFISFVMPDLKCKFVAAKYDFGDAVTLNIKYLHQLQNLLFALTGQELEVNLSTPIPA